MAFYDLPKEERALLAAHIHQQLEQDLASGKMEYILQYYNDPDTYIRKVAYVATGRIYANADKTRQLQIISSLTSLLQHESYYIRQTTVNAAGEVGRFTFEPIEHIMHHALFDAHHTVRNAVIGSVKKMGEKNPVPVLAWSRKYLHHPDKEIRREICHGIELRGRTHPEDILPLLQELEFDQAARVRNTLIHVIGQIAYKKGCLATVITHLCQWENQQLVQAAIEEIIDVHHRYRNFAYMTQDDARLFIEKNFKSKTY